MSLIMGEQTIKVVVAIKCDRCGREDEEGGFEFGDYLRISDSGGYASIFGDGNRITCDLCQYCIRATLGPWLQVDGTEVNPACDWHEHVFANADHVTRTDEEERFDRLDVIENTEELGRHYSYIWDPVTKVRMFGFGENGRQRAIEFAKELVQKIKRNLG
jgi:hypothetical protein